MYPYHQVIARYQSWIEFYVVDARRLPSGRALCQVTVLVPSTMAWTMVMDLYFELMECMHQTALHELVGDLGCESPSDRDVVFTALVKPVRAAQP